jgi:hypothetical protein
VKHGKVCHACAANGKPQFPPEDGSKLDCPMKLVRAAQPFGDGVAKKRARVKKEGGAKKKPKQKAVKVE